MSGADLSADDIANGVFHVLYPECLPGSPNHCDTQICDCFAADQLPAQVAALVAERDALREALENLATLVTSWADYEYWQTNAEKVLATLAAPEKGSDV